MSVGVSGHSSPWIIGVQARYSCAVSRDVGRLDVSDSVVGKHIRIELEETRREFHALLASLSAADWDAPSRNPAWTNGQLIFHMVFAFMLIPSLFWLIRFWSCLPGSYSRAFARVLDFSTPLFNWVNALGPRGQATVFGRRRAGSIYDRVHRSILRKVDSMKDDDWGRGMTYPQRWDPDFGACMTFERLFRYPTQHFRRHLAQLSGGTAPARSTC
jgi:DinB superfamily